MLRIKSVTLRNFLSCGNVPQTVELDKHSVSLILGENMDLGANGNRNGVGKSALLQAITFGLYGQALTSIKKDNLINNINCKNMHVTVVFEINGHTYQIERGRKPTFFKFIVDNQDVNSDVTDDAQGENKESQKEIDTLLGMSYTMFKHIIALNTFTEPFLSLGAPKQREIIEELLGITMLSQKAENLKEKIKVTKAAIEGEEFRIRTVKQSNERIQLTINDIAKKEAMWTTKHLTTIKELSDSISHLEHIDISVEVQAQRDNENYNELISLKSSLTKDIGLKNRHLTQYTTQLTAAMTNYEKTMNHECFNCGQSIHDQNHEKIKKDLETKIMQLDMQTKQDQTELDIQTNELKIIDEALSSMIKPVVIYKNLEQALNHKNTLEQLQKELDKEALLENPYSDQTTSITSSIQEVTYDNINKYAYDREHQEFLLKLLTNKESFIRKKIIDQNLTYLNVRLNDYLDRIGLPHNVKFINDLSVEIKMLGHDLDFDNLSRGERTRLILGLSWAFRDIFENGNHPVNLMFIDELIDQGLDGAGAERAIEILKDMGRNRNKNIFLISHKEDLISRVNSVLSVMKENDFTTFTWDHDPTV